LSLPLELNNQKVLPGESRVTVDEIVSELAAKVGQSLVGENSQDTIGEQDKGDMIHIPGLHRRHAKMLRNSI